MLFSEPGNGPYFLTTDLILLLFLLFFLFLFYLEGGGRIVDNPQWEISNKSLKKMDEERVGINVASASYERQLGGDPFPYASLSTGDEIAERAKVILKRASRIDRTRLNAFDSAIYDDIFHHAKMAKAYHSYFVDAGSKMGIGRFLSEFFSPGTYTGFLDAAKPENLPHDLFREEELLRAQVFSKTPDSLTICYGSSPWAREHQEHLLDALRRAKKFVEPFYKLNGIGPLEFNLQLGPAGGGFSYWMGETLMAAIDPDRFSFSEGKYDHFLPSLILAHELGHGHHGRQSKNLPRGLNPTDEEYAVSFHGSCGEGVALTVEERFIDYSTKHKDFPPGEKEAMKLFWATYLPKKVFQITHDLLEKKEQEEIANSNFPESLKRGTAHERLAEITGIRAFSDYFSFSDPTILESTQQMGYQIGNKNLGRIMARLRRKRVPSEIAFNSILQGVWVNPRAQEDFIFNAYLPEVLKS